MKIKNLIKMLLLLLLVFGCSETKKEVNDPDPENVTIGTFNIAWLGDGIDDRIMREEEHYSRIADVISTTGADILALQEVENERAVERVLKYLKDYSYHVSKGGGHLNLAVLYKNTVDLEIIGDYNPLIVEKNRTRPGLLFEAKKGNFDFVVMTVHFKSTSRYDNSPEKRRKSIELRKKQAFRAAEWIEKTLEDGSEEDLFIIGDFNDTPNRKKDPSLTVLHSKAGLRFLTKDMKSCKYSGWHVIDHIAVTSSAAQRFKSGTPMMFNVWDAYPHEDADYISDHCPIYAKFEVTSPDND